MSMCKSSMVMGTLAEKSIDWTKVPDEELATDIDDMDSRYKGPKRHNKRLNGSARWKRQKNAGRRRRRGVRGKQKQEAKKARQGASAAAEARKWQQADSEAQASRSWMNVSACVSGHQEKVSVWVMHEGQRVIQWPPGEDRLVGQQQVLLSKLVEIASTAGSRGSKEVIEDQEELKEPQGEESGGQEGDTEGVPGGVPEGELEDVLGNEPEDGTGAEDGTGEEAQKKDKGKGKEKAL
ncbi:hypothetical protein ID866_10872 [Astraeus odoratus]|nr:hypothetical protein ID866_10872 [Astraeus odoratus]